MLLVDDRALVRMGLRLVLESEPDLEVVGEAADGAVALDQVRALVPDVVLVDVRMPGTDGIEATRRIAAENPASLTTFDVDECAFAASRAGAGGFLVKSAEPRELVEAIRVGASGSSVMAPRAVRRMLDLFATQLPAGGGGRGDLNPRLRSLTPRELDVLRCIAEGLSNAEIAERFVLSQTTVKTHAGNVLAKLGLRDRVQAVIAAFESGLAGSDGGGGPRP